MTKRRNVPGARVVKVQRGCSLVLAVYLTIAVAVGICRAGLGHSV